MLTSDQITHFHDQGYLIVEDVLPDSLLESVRAEYADVLDGLLEGWGLENLRAANFEEQLIAAYKAGYDWFQPLDISLPGDRIEADTPMHFGPAVFDMVTCASILDIVEQLIGPEITSCPIQHVRIKPPVGDLHGEEARAHVGGTDWHQDRAVALEEADQTTMVTVWIAITDATKENGCLQTMPLATEMLPHCPRKQTALADAYVNEAAARALPVRAGGIVLLHPLTPHASLPNLSNGIRWSFDLRYSKTSEPTGRSHFPEFVARSEQHPVLQDWREWRHMWEQARISCAAAEHIDIHRWRSDAPACA